MEKRDGWYIRRHYRHFDLSLNFDDALALVSKPTAVAAHSFYPFLAYEKEERQLKRVHMRDKSHKKKRPIRYAAHTDGYIFSYYAKQLAELYKNKLQALDLQEGVLAYLKGNGSNIEFARDAFNEVEKRDACVAITFDISSFFDSLDHALLKRRWCELLGQQTLPDDHYKIFRAITQYSYAQCDACYAALGIDEKNVPTRLVKDAREYREKIRGNKLVITNNSSFGIPQGSPISALLSNIYMLSFDEKMQQMANKVGGYYRRYSDDILWICDAQHQAQIVALVQNEIKKMGAQLAINDKTTITHFSRNATGQLEAKGDRFQYLGFEFDGRQRLVRSSTLSRFWRRATYGVRYAKNRAKKAAKSSGNAKVFKRKLYRKFSHLGQSNFIQYAYRANEVIKGNSSIRGQVKKHWTRLQREINNP